MRGPAVDRPKRRSDYFTRSLGCDGADGQVGASRAFEHRAGDESRPGQVRDGRGHILGRADPAYRAGDASAHPVDPVVRANR